MRKTTLILTLATLLTVATSATAETSHTFSGGYASGDMFNARGYNVKYAYGNSELPIGWVGSFTSTWKDIPWAHYQPSKFNYYALTTGPSVRVFDRVNLYGLIGVNKSTMRYYGPAHTPDAYGFTWSAGAQIDLMENLVLDAGFEQSHMSYGKRYDHKESWKYNIWTVGLGYRF